jgi:hypothetical protein
MARLFLHIGAHKTATSYLQGLFHHNRKALLAAGLHYPFIGPNTAHHALAAAWLDMPDLPLGFFGEDGPDGLWDRAILRPYADRPGTLFLSAEIFTRFRPRRVDMAALARRLAVFDEVRIVYCLREQTGLLASLWMQTARSRKPPHLRPYMERVFAEGLGGGVPLDHHAVYNHILTGFAPEQVIVLDYDAIRQQPGGVAQAFLDLLDCPLRAADLVPPPQTAFNISPDPLALWLATQVCRKQPPPEALVQMIAAILYPEPQPSTLLTEREHARVRAKFRDGNAILAARVAAVQPGFRFEPAPPPANLMYRDRIAPHVWPDIAAALWSEMPGSGLGGMLKRMIARLSA